ncbi:MAG: glycosyltransferase [Bacteroidota bacterium]
MRILCPAGYPPDLAGMLWGLRGLGHEVEICELGWLPTERKVPAWRGSWSRFRPDLVFFFGFWKGLYDLSTLDPPPGWPRVPVVYWAADDPVFMGELSLPLLAGIDLILTPAEECADLYARRGRRSGVINFGCNPELQRRVRPAEQHQFVHVGTNYTYFKTTSFRLKSTANILMSLLEAGYDVHVWGSFWTEERAAYRVPARLFHGYLPHTRLAEVYSGAEIVLGLQFSNLSRTQTSSRVFETLACGAFYLGPDTPGTRCHFTPGRHLVLSGSPLETLSLARYYLDHPGERARIAAAGQREVLRRHTYLHRAREMMAIVNQVY